jgi:hypothetical protein
LALFRIGRLPFAIAAVALLSGCAGSTGNSDDALGSFLVAPGKYTLFACEDLAIEAKGNLKRRRELEGLMAKADTGAGGEFVNAIAYRSEYAERRGDLNELRKAAVARNCKDIPELRDDTGRTSDSAVR